MIRKIHPLLSSKSPWHLALMSSENRLVGLLLLELEYAYCLTRVSLLFQTDSTRLMIKKIHTEHFWQHCPTVANWKHSTFTLSRISRNGYAAAATFFHSKQRREIHKKMRSWNFLLGRWADPGGGGTPKKNDPKRLHTCWTAGHLIRYWDMEHENHKY